MDIRLNRYPQMVQEYYVGRVREAMAKRIEARSRVKTRADVHGLQSEIRRAIRECFGRRPPRSPLNARVTGMLDRATYTVEKVLYESRPGFVVSANLYVPRGLKRPAPCVLGLCGHNDDGKAADIYQSFSQGLARKGFVCLILDPISQGERVQYPNGKLRCKLGLCQEHNMLGNQQALVGEFFGMWRAWDAIRGLDYLLGRPEADPKRVGVTGISGGGTMTTWMLALDDRFTMGAPGCFVTTLPSNLEGELVADVEQIPPGILRLGLDQHELLIPFAPRPLVIMAPAKDFFDYRGTVQAYRELKRIWGILGSADNLRLFTGAGVHGYPKDLREAMYGFFAKHSGLKVPAREPRLTIEPEKSLWATKRGLVAREGSRLVFDFTRERAVELRAKRGRVAGLRKALADTLVLPKRCGPPNYRRLSVLDVGKLRFQNFALETEPGIQALVTLSDPVGWRSPAPTGKRCKLLVPHRGACDDLVLPKMKKRLAGAGPTFAVDPRGIGQSLAALCDVAPPFAPFDADYFYHCYALMLGETYLGRRVHDVLSTLDWLGSLGYEDIHVVGRGMGSLPALMACVLDERPTKVTLVNGLLSFHELTQTPLYAWPASAMPRGVLSRFDLPDCFRALKGKLRIVEPWDARMKPIPRAAARKRLKEMGPATSIG